MEVPPLDGSKIMTKPDSRRSWTFPGPSLAALYLILTAGPVFFAAVRGGLEAPTVFPIIARAAGVAALAMFLMQFATSGRFEVISGRIGLDRTMGFHRLAAVGALLMVLMHVVFFLPRGRDGSLDAMAQRLVLYVSSPGLATGLIATFLAVVLVVTGKHLRGRWIPYPLWRLSHGVLAVAVVLLGLHHGFANARFMADPFGSTAMLIVALLAFSSLLIVYLLRPLLAFRPGFSVASARALSPTVSELVLEAKRPELFSFTAGQFAWLTIGRRHTVTDNPFSIASAPRDLPRLRFLIRNAGDMTAAVPGLAPGTPVGVDGPHGSFTLDEAGPGPILLVAGGIGIAPILSLLRALAAADDPRPIRLIAGARTPQDHLVRTEIETLMRGRAFEAIHLVDGGGDGRICETASFSTDHVRRALGGLEAAETTAFVCGPPPMMESAVAILLDAGVPLDGIVMERFDFDAGHDAVCRAVRRRFVILLSTVFASVASIALIASI